VYSEDQYLASQTVFLTFMLGGLSMILGLIMGLAAVFTATNTMFSAIAARTHEIGILLAMGSVRSRSSCRSCSKRSCSA
jgi:ABC-type antimicrobial peptide transport system permease subunit